MAGSGPFGLITGALGERDARDDIADYQAQQLAKNRAAMGLDPDGNPLPQQPPQQPGAGAPGAAPGGAPPIQMQDPSKTPEAHKTPADLGTMLMRLGQQEERNQGFNQALGMGFAAFAQPRDREMVSKMFNTNLQDPNALGKTLFEANNQQAGQDQTNAIRSAINNPQQGPLIAQKLNMSWEALKAAVAADPGAAGKIATALGMPTDALKNISQLGVMGGGGPGGKPATDANGNPISDATKGIVAGVAGPELTPMNLAQEAWRSNPKNAGKPDSEMPWKAGNLQSFNQYTIDEKAKSDDRQTASNELDSKNETARTLQSDLQALKESPGLKQIMTTPGMREVANKVLTDGQSTDVPSIMARSSLNAEQAQAIALLRRIGGATTESAMRGMAGTGTRVTQAEVGPLKDAITMTQNLNPSYEDYVHGAINSAMSKTKRAIAANYGNTGNLKNIPDEYKPWLTTTFKKGGQLYNDESGVDDIAPAGAVPASEIEAGKKLLKDKPYLRDEMLDNWQQRNLDTDKLRGKSPSQW